MHETDDTGQPAQTEYERPKVESVLTAEELDREILYAGAGIQSILPDGLS